MTRCSHVYSFFNLARSSLLVALLTFMVLQNDATLSATTDTIVQSPDRCLQCYTHATHATTSPPYFDLDSCLSVLQSHSVNLTADAVPHAMLAGDDAWAISSRSHSTSAIVGALLLALFWLILSCRFPIRRRRIRIPHRSDGDALGLFITSELLIAIPTLIFVAYHAARGFDHFVAIRPDLVLPTTAAPHLSSPLYHMVDEHEHDDESFHDRSLLSVDAHLSRHSVASSQLLIKPTAAPPHTPAPVSSHASHEHSRFGSIAAHVLSPTSKAVAVEVLPTKGTFGPCLFVTLSPEFAFVDYIGIGVCLIAGAIWALSHSWLSQFEIFLLLLTAPVAEALIFFGEACMIYSASSQFWPFALTLIALWANIEVVLVQVWLYDLVSPWCDAEYIAPLDL